MNELNIIAFDTETGGVDFTRHEVLSIGAKAYNGRTLEPFPAEQGGEFYSLMKPLHFDRLQDEALAVNGITREELKKAPDQKVVWLQFVDWVQRYNIKGKSPFGAPIACGKNIRSFDLLFVEKLCQLHCPKKEKTVLFHRRRQLELEDYVFAWFESTSELPNEKMDTLRDYFGLSHDGAHSALVDAQQTGDLMIRFLKLHRELRKRTKSDGEPLIKFRRAA